MQGNHYLVWISLALPRQLQVKTENIYLFGKKSWKLKTWLCPNFSCCPKNLSCPKFGGAAAPPAPRPVRLWTQQCTRARFILLYLTLLSLINSKIRIHFVFSRGSSCDYRNYRKRKMQGRYNRVGCTIFSPCCYTVLMKTDKSKKQLSTVAHFWLSDCSLFYAE